MNGWKSRAEFGLRENQCLQSGAAKDFSVPWGSSGADIVYFLIQCVYIHLESECERVEISFLVGKVSDHKQSVVL
jgi:hypothetical protein